MAASALATVVTVSGAITILLFPNKLFAYQMQYRQVNIYSNEPIDQTITSVLRKALSRCEESELYDAQYRLDLFLAYGTWYNDYHGALLGGATSAKSTQNNIVIQVPIDLHQSKFYRAGFQPCEGDLVYLVAHEMVHNLQYHRYGATTFNPIHPPPMWKLEGYPEYIARQPQRTEPSYSLEAEIDRYLTEAGNSVDGFVASKEGGCKAPYYYYKGRLMVEYLMDVKGWSYDRIMNDTASEDAVFASVLEWRHAQKR